MDEELQKDIINVFQKHNRYDLITMILNIIEEADSEYVPSDEEEPMEEYSECGCLPEDPSFCISDDGFYSLK